MDVGPSTSFIVYSTDPQYPPAPPSMQESASEYSSGNKRVGRMPIAEVQNNFESYKDARYSVKRAKCKHCGGQRSWQTTALHKHLKDCRPYLNRQRGTTPPVATDQWSLFDARPPGDTRLQTPPLPRRRSRSPQSAPQTVPYTLLGSLSNHQSLAANGASTVPRHRQLPGNPYTNLQQDAVSPSDSARSAPSDTRDTNHVDGNLTAIGGLREQILANIHSVNPGVGPVEVVIARNGQTFYQALVIQKATRKVVTMTGRNDARSTTAALAALLDMTCKQVAPVEVNGEHFVMYKAH